MAKPTSWFEGALCNKAFAEHTEDPAFEKIPGELHLGQQVEVTLSSEEGESCDSCTVIKGAYIVGIGFELNSIHYAIAFPIAGSELLTVVKGVPDHCVRK